LSGIAYFFGFNCALCEHIYFLPTLKGTPMKNLYTARSNVAGGHDGGATPSDGHLNLRLALPRERGAAGNAANPEQLIGAGYAAWLAVQGPGERAGEALAKASRLGAHCSVSRGNPFTAA
jgi:hypothetical protein